MSRFQILLADAGVVVSAAPLVSIVSLTPGYTQRLSDAYGRFHFPDVRLGTYRLVVRQIAHVPFDTWAYGTLPS